MYRRVGPLSRCLLPLLCPRYRCGPAAVSTVDGHRWSLQRPSVLRATMNQHSGQIQKTSSVEWSRRLALDGEGGTLHTRSDITTVALIDWMRFGVVAAGRGRRTHDTHMTTGGILHEHCWSYSSCCGATERVRLSVASDVPKPLVMSDAPRGVADGSRLGKT